MKGTPVSEKVSFADFYSQAQMVAYQAHWNANPSVDSFNDPLVVAWREAGKPMGSEFSAAIGNFLKAMGDEGLLSPIAYTERRGHRWADAWNRLVGRTADEFDIDELAESLTCTLRATRFSDRGTSGGDKNYLPLVAAMDAGDFRLSSLWTDCKSECQVTGERLTADIQAGWAPRLGNIDYSRAKETGGSPFIPLTQEAPLTQVLVHEIAAPTGEMLIADWFRFDDNLFTEIVKPKTGRISINTAFGCGQQAEYYAKNFGFMSVEVGNSCPSIVVREGHVIIGCTGEDAESLQGEVAGSVCTDLWWASMIDRQVLVDLLATRLPREEAEARVAKIIADGDVTVLKQPPGVLYVHHTASRDDLALFRCQGPIAVEKGGMTEPFLVISSQRLDWHLIEQITCDDATPLPKP